MPTALVDIGLWACGIIILYGVVSTFISRRVRPKLSIAGVGGEFQHDNRIYSMQGDEPKRQITLWINVAILVYSLGVLSVGIYVFIAARNDITLDIGWLIIFVIFVLVPYYFALNTIGTFQSYKTGKSMAITAERKLLIGDNIDNMFNTCIDALNAMHHSGIWYEKPKQITARINKSLLFVKLNKVAGGKTRLQFYVDNLLLTRNSNRKGNIKIRNDFEGLISDCYGRPSIKEVKMAKSEPQPPLTKKRFFGLLTKAAQPVADWESAPEASETSESHPSDGCNETHKNQGKTGDTEG